MSPARKRFTVWKVNLVEQPGWEPFDPAGDLTERVFDLAAGSLGDLGIMDYTPMIEDLAGSLYNPKGSHGPHDWSPRKQLTPHDIGMIAGGVITGDQRLELVEMTIRDVTASMYEVALTPTDNDVRDALLEAKHEVCKSFEFGEMSDPWELGIDNLWAPLLETGLTLDGIITNVVGMGVSYTRQVGHYDRFLEFDLNRSSAPDDLLAAIPRKDRGWVTQEIMKDWERLSQDLLKRFFMILGKDMKNVDVSNRTSWKARWRDMLKSTDLKPIQDEMVEFIRDEQRGAPLPA